MSKPNDRETLEREQAPNLRRYAPHPLADEPREEPRYERSDEQWFLDEQCPSERYFGR
jgi:hypothetical protein